MLEAGWMFAKSVGDVCAVVEGAVKCASDKRRPHSKVFPGIRRLHTNARTNARLGRITRAMDKAKLHGRGLGAQAYHASTSRF